MTIDVFIRPTQANATRLLTALADFGFPVEQLQPTEVIAPNRVLQMGVVTRVRLVPA